MRSLALATAVCIACTAGGPRATTSPLAEVTPAIATTTPPRSPLASVTAASAMPLFDAHVHYSQEAWALYTPEQALEMLARAGVSRALVSSTPDDGTFLLYDRAPDVVVPFLRPYRASVGAGAWARDGTTVAYVRSRYRPGVHRGIGEIHLAAGESELPVVRALVDLAVSERIWLQIHTDTRGIDQVMRGPAAGTRVLWAHAGQTATPTEIARLVERYPSMWVELSGRTDIAPGGTIDPAWRDLFTRYPDRFLVGSDTWINSQWDRLPEIEAGHRAWLAQLPPDIAQRIATGNAEALFPPRK